MKIALLYLYIALFSVYQTDTTTKTYKFERISDRGGLLTDYIQLVFQDGLIVKGVYYGNENDYHFVSDIKFKINTADNISFLLTNYRFCNENADPFHKIEYHEMKNLPLDLENGINFSGIITSKQLSLERTLWHYDSRFDNMLFTLEKEE